MGQLTTKGARAQPSNRLRVAVVGTGDWWGREHARVLSAHPDVDLCAIVGRSSEKTERRALEFATTPYVDLDKMLHDEAPDLVSLCLPNESHFETTLKVIEAGYPLLVEKPFVFDLGEADRLLREADERNLFFAINFNHRYARPVRLAHEAIVSGALGEITFATWRFGGEVGSSTHPHANLIETQCHGFDMLEHLCGPIESVSAHMSDPVGKGYTTMAVALTFASGAVGSLVGSYDSSYAYPETHYVEVNGSAGRVQIVDTVKRFTHSVPGAESRQVWEAGYFNDRDRDFDHMFELHLDEILKALRQSEEPPIHARAGRRALLLATACIQSFEESRQVAVA
jgi:myo-inositol 2-dehydrogenase / D-chiro-inositol 1-dehydrogenase